MNSFVRSINDINRAQLVLFGGKAVHLGELSHIAEINVPDGFCISTAAFQLMMGQTPLIDQLLDQLSRAKVADADKIGQLSSQLRYVIEKMVIPQAIVDEISIFLTRLGENDAYAVRSSATAEDLPTASFAGQQDTYLNVIGKEEILKHISKCWASLFTERAVIYRIQNNFDHRKVQLAMVVQKMVFPLASGILFTADPVTSHRKVSSIDAGFGLGEALVSGLVNADVYKVRESNIISRKISAKKIALNAAKNGGTISEEIELKRQNIQALTDEQIVKLEGIGRKIEKYFGHPQDIEWCLVGDTFYIVQSRPITTLFPVPLTSDTDNHIYISVGHQQMMTDPLKPLGMSIRQLTAFRPMFEAAGRQFVDVTAQLSAPASRYALLSVMGQHDPLMKDALVGLIERGDFIKTIPADENVTDTPGSDTSWNFKPRIENDPAIASDLVKACEASIEELKQNIASKSGTELFDFILEDIQQLKKVLFDPRSSAIFMTAMDAAAWLNEKLMDWLGEKNASDILSQSVPNNITSEMGLALLDVADTIRPYPAIVGYLQHVKDSDFLQELPRFEGGGKVRNAIQAFLNRYGMRCVGEIDITRTRWSENPQILVPMILSNVRNFNNGAGKNKFEQGLQEALKKEHELLERLKQLPDGEEKTAETKKAIDFLRNFIGYREYPKYGMVCRYFVYKKALIKEAQRLKQLNIVNDIEDVYYLTLEEFREAVSTNKLNYQLVNKRKEEFRWYEKLTPPRVITSDGEIITGRYRQADLPPGALVGLAVSTGVVEGRARVILNVEDASLEVGDILVTPFTDPSWTPLFVSARALVTEVGGLMTHGAVIAREYGLPAVIGVENATTRIKDGQLIRVNGTEGYIELL